MGITANIEEHERLYLKGYAHFVLENKLEDVVSVYLMNIHSFDIPILRFFSHLSDEQLIASARQTMNQLLRGLENGNAIEDVKKNLDNWRDNYLQNLPREAVSLNDITLIYSAQKISFQSFIPYYTPDVSVATQVIQEIEMHYKQVQEMALHMLELIKTEEYEKRLESEEKYRNLFDNASDLIHILDEEGLILYVNNAWCLTLGYRAESIKGKSIYDFIKPGESENFRKIRQRVKDENKLSTTVRTYFLKENGEEVVVEGSINFTYKKNKLEYTTALLHDITSKIKQEQQIEFYIDRLADREKNLRDIIEHAPDGVIVIDKENTIILWNPKAQDIFGWTKEEVTGKKITDVIVPEEFRQGHSNGLKRFVQTRQPTILNQTVEVPAVHKKGHQFYISLTVSNSTQNGNDLFIAFLRDITDQKRNEIELENKRKQLERSNQELEQYAWLASHDLKEPLRKILTFSDALLKTREDNLTEQYKSYVTKIHSSAGRMKNLIEAVLSYSNVASEQDLFVTTDLNGIIRGVIEDLEISITLKNAVIEYGNLPSIEAIPVQMSQLFQNLVSNSLKYSKPGKEPIIKIDSRKENDGYIFSIEDNGIGFEKIYADKIFNVFQRLHSRSYEGTGIGLALCKKIAETHKGFISAKSEVGVGSTFTVYLPAKHVA